MTRKPKKFEEAIELIHRLYILGMDGFPVGKVHSPTGEGEEERRMAMFNAGISAAINVLQVSPKKSKRSPKKIKR